MSEARKILFNTIAQIIGKVFLAILGLMVVKVTTNYLSVEGFGEYTAIYEFLAYFGIIADLGLFTVAVKELSENEHQTTKIIGNIFSIRMILALSTMLLAIFTGFLISKFDNTSIPWGIAIASITVLLTIMNGTITSVLQAKMKMQLSSVTIVFGKVISVAFMAYVAFFGFPNDKETGFYMLILAGNFGALATYIGTAYYVSKITPIRFRCDFYLWKELLKKSIPYGVALILSTIYFRIDSIFILFMRGKEELAIYAVAMRMLEQIAILPLYFMNSVLPVLTKAIKQQSEHYKNLIKYAFDFLAALSIPMVIGGVLLAYPIVFIVSRPEYLTRLSENFYGSDIAFKILVFASLFQFLNVLFAFILIAVDKQYKMLYINSACVILKIILSYLFIPTYGFIAAALSSVLCELFILIATFFAAKKSLKFSVNKINILKIAFSAVVMGIAIKFLQPLTYPFIQNWNVIFLIPFAMIIYMAMLYFTKTINKDMLKLLKKPPAHVDPPGINHTP